MADSEILAQALRKVRIILHGDTRHPDFSAQELVELRDCILPRLADSSLSERDRLSCEQVMAVVRDNWVSSGLEEPLPGVSGRDVGQHGFRATLDKFLQARYAEVTRDDLRTLRAASNRLAAAAFGRTSSHDRLQRMITGCLERYRVYLTETASGELPEAEPKSEPGPEDGARGAESVESLLTAGLLPDVPALRSSQAVEEPPETYERLPLNVPAGGTRRRAEDLFASLRRVELEYLRDIPVKLRVRHCEVEGDLVVEGDVPEDVFIRVNGGGLTVEGFVSGHAHADGGIRVTGNVNAGWLVSEQGDIAVDRALMGVRLVARKGVVACAWVEGAGLMIAGGAIRVANDVRGGLLAARDVEVGGALHSATVLCIGTVTAQAVESAGKESARIVLQRFLPLRALGTELTPELVKAFRSLQEASLRANVLRAFRTGLFTDRLHLLRAILFETRAALMTGYALTDLRDAQLRHAYLPMVLALGQELHSGVLEAWEMEEEYAGRSAGALADIVLGLAGWVEREVAAHSPGLLKQGRMLTEQCLRHVVSAARKLRDGGPRDGAAADALETLAERLDEFSALAEDAAGEANALLSQCPREMLLQLSDNLEALRARVEEAAGADSGSRRQARGLQELRRHIDHIDGEVRVLEKQFAEFSALGDAHRRELSVAGAAVFPDTWPGRARARAKRFSAGVVISTTPLANPVRKLPMGAYVLIPDALSGEEVVFERLGHTVRKAVNATANPDKTA